MNDKARSIRQLRDVRILLNDAIMLLDEATRGTGAEKEASEGIISQLEDLVSGYSVIDDLIALV